MILVQKFLILKKQEKIKLKETILKVQDSQDTIAVIGTGVIGTGWIIRFLFNKKS